MLFLAGDSDCCTPYYFVLGGFLGPRLGVHDVLISPTVHHVLRCPCGLLRLPTHGLDIIETSGRTPIIRDKAKPREKQKQQLEPIEEDALCVNGKKRERERRA